MLHSLIINLSVSRDANRMMKGQEISYLSNDKRAPGLNGPSLSTFAYGPQYDKNAHERQAEKLLQNGDVYEME